MGNLWKKSITFGAQLSFRDSRLSKSHAFFLLLGLSSVKISLNSLRRMSTTLFCWMQSMAMLCACSAGAHSRVGPKTMARLAVCIRFRSLRCVTLENVIKIKIGKHKVHSFIYCVYVHSLFLNQINLP